MNEIKTNTTKGGMAVTTGSGNVFRDLGFDEVEAANLQVRSLMMQRLQAFVREEKMTQEVAAELFGVHQPRISQLIQGKIGEFSIDALVNMLAKAQLRVEIDFVSA